MTVQDLIQQAKDAVAAARKAAEDEQRAQEAADMLARASILTEIVIDMPDLKPYAQWLDVYHAEPREMPGESERRAILTLRLPDCDLIELCVEQTKPHYRADWGKWDWPASLALRTFEVCPDVPDWYDRRISGLYETLPEAIAAAADREATARAEQGIVRFEPDPVEPDPLERIAAALERLAYTLDNRAF